MIFDDSTGLPDDFVTYQQLFEHDPEGLISFHPMSGYGKQPQYDMLGMNLHAAANALSDSDAFSGFMPPAYGPQLTNQHALTAIPHDPATEYLVGGEYTQPYEFVGSRHPSTEVIGRRMVSSNTFDQPEALRAVVNDSQQYSRKRKASVESEYDEPYPQKKAAITQLHLQDPNGEYYDLSGQTSPYSSFVPTPGAGSVYQPSHGPNASPRPVGHHYSTSNASQVSLAAPSPHTPAWSPSFTTVKTEHSPRPPMTPVPRPASTSSPYSATLPKLVRTSTIPQQSSPGVGPVIGTAVHTHAFNPYSMYPQNKATLRLRGDLDAVAKEWSGEELEARRKLVVFKRSQTGSTIDADFKVVPQQDWNRADITVNCIWWKERKECFVTSVDTIALLEQLVAVRFTVEEKNRIRRNLEGFRPLTVSKAKADSEDFFKVIMGFAAPKPRNIEKDVKVFPWKILSHALKKIISKYSASYSSTASTLVNPAPAIYAPTDAPNEYHYPPSPHQELIPGSMPPSTMVAAYETGMMAGRMSAPVTTVPELQLQMPTMGPAYEMIQHYGYAPLQLAPGHMQYAQQAISAPVASMHPSWHFGNFVHEGPAPLAPASAPPTAYPRGPIETADLVTPAAYQMRHR